MNKLQKLATATLLSMLTFSVYASEDALDASEAKVDAIVMACEEQFSPETYADEEDRINKINDCVDGRLNEGQSKTEDKG